MNFQKLISSGTASSPQVAALVYAGLMIVLVAIIATSWTGVLSRNAAVSGLSDILSRLEGANPAGARSRDGDAAVSGSYFLEGPTVTVAGAAMLQRVIGIVTKHGGNVLSSQVDLKATQSKDGFVTVIANCTMDQPALQPIIYEIEAGMPFLFVEQLDAQLSIGSNATGAGSAAPDTTGAKLRVLLSVAGQWHGAR
jgi:general secretion pathway protein M